MKINNFVSGYLKNNLGLPAGGANTVAAGRANTAPTGVVNTAAAGGLNAAATAGAKLGTSGNAAFDQILETAFEDARTNQLTEKIENSANKKDLEGLKEASEQFEAYFINLLLKQMRRTSLGADLVPKSQARETFEGMLDQEYAKSMAKGEGIGLAKSLYESMKKAYE